MGKRFDQARFMYTHTHKTQMANKHVRRCSAFLVMQAINEICSLSYGGMREECRWYTRVNPRVITNRIYHNLIYTPRNSKQQSVLLRHTKTTARKASSEWTKSVERGARDLIPSFNTFWHFKKRCIILMNRKYKRGKNLRMGGGEWMGGREEKSG